jgi:hypothetical protein
MDAQNAPTAAWKSRPEREIPTPPTAIISFLITRTDRNDRRGKSRFLRFHVVSDIQTLMRHKQLTMTQQYTHVPPAAMESAIGLLNNRAAQIGNMRATGTAPSAKHNG